LCGLAADVLSALPERRREAFRPGGVSTLKICSSVLASSPQVRRRASLVRKSVDAVRNLVRKSVDAVRNLPGEVAASSRALLVDCRLVGLFISFDGNG